MRLVFAARSTTRLENEQIGPKEPMKHCKFRFKIPEKTKIDQK